MLRQRSWSPLAQALCSWHQKLLDSDKYGGKRSEAGLLSNAEQVRLGAGTTEDSPMFYCFLVPAPSFCAAVPKELLSVLPHFHTM